MSARMLPVAGDPIHPRAAATVSLTLDGEELHGLAGQTIAGALLASGRLDWRSTSGSGRPRGMFCGIGVCFDCIVTVNGERDVRACQRRVTDGDVVDSQRDPLPELEHE